MNIDRILAAVLMLAAATFSAFASPADRVLTLKQPDGYTFSARLRGDEFAHILKTVDGCAVVQDDDGYYCYARYDSDGLIYSSGYHIGSDAPADVISSSRQIPYQKISAMAAEKRLAVKAADTKPLLKRVLEAKAMTKAGGAVSKHGLVILAQFSDVSFSYTRQDFVEMLTTPGYSRNGATGSAMDYFNDQFEGKVEFSFDVSEIVTLPRSRSWYGKDDPEGNDANPAQMIYDACKEADSSVDFSLYDDDGDGEVDNVFVFYAGADEAQTAESDLIWSHAWYIRDGAGMSLTLDGKVINRYACTSELTGAESDARIAPIGTFCHEYTHTFGLPDFYDTDYEGSDGLVSAALWRSTSLMDAGNYNNDGNTPPNLNAIEREYLGLSEPETMTEGEYILEPISENGRYLRLDTGTEGEYFLFECRSGKGWDAYINGGTGAARGMLIYHIDKSSVRNIFSEVYNTVTTPELRWSLYNEVNANPAHQCADLIEADGRSDRLSSGIYGNLAEIFFPAGSSSFTEDGTPSFKDWNGDGMPLSITGIEHAGDNIRFTVSSSSEIIPNVRNITTDIFQDAVIISWESDIATRKSAYLTGSWDNKETEVIPYADGKYCITVEGLEPGSQYSLSIMFKSASGTDGKPATSAFRTKSLYKENAFPYIYFPKSGRVSTGTFKKGTRLPLRVMNATDAVSVTWTLDGKVITDASDGTPDGYYILDTGGELKAELTYHNGEKEVITRKIIISF